MNITKLYNQLQEGTVSKDHFVKVARMQFPQYISPVSSYKDIVTILKGKRLISESPLKGLSIDQRMIKPLAMALKLKAEYDLNDQSTDDEIRRALQDYLKYAAIAPEIVAKAINDENWFEELKNNIIDPGYAAMQSKQNIDQGAQDAINSQYDESLNEAKLTTDQIIDRLSPYAVKKGIQIELDKTRDYSDEGLRRVKERVAKKLQKNPKAYDEVDKKAEKANEKQQLKDYKETEKKDTANATKVAKKLDKANTKASKKENKKGAPKGVKQMKESILGSISNFIVENTYHDYHSNMEVMTPDGEGIVTQVVGGTLTVELKSGDKKDYQINVVDHATKEAKEAQDAANQHPTYDEMVNYKSDIDSKKESIIKKLKEFFSKKKIKKEDLFTDPANPTAKPVVGSSPATRAALTRARYKVIPGTSDAK